jgi:hypothetical protein
MRIARLATGAGPFYATWTDDGWGLIEDWTGGAPVPTGDVIAHDRAWLLPAAQASVGPDERFEGGDVERDVFDPAVDIEVCGLRHLDRATEHPGCMVAVRPDRISTDHRASDEADAVVCA